VNGEVTIYGLVDPRDGKTRYIGQTTKPLDKRLDAHCKAAYGCFKSAWIKELRAVGLTPRIIALDSVSYEDADNAEKRWIENAENRGCDLTNRNPTPSAGKLRLDRVERPTQEFVQVRVSKEDHARLKAWAAHNSTSVSYVVRRLVERTLRQDEDKAGTLP